MDRNTKTAYCNSEDYSKMARRDNFKTSQAMGRFENPKEFYEVEYAIDPTKIWNNTTQIGGCVRLFGE